MKYFLRITSLITCREHSRCLEGVLKSVTECGRVQYRREIHLCRLNTRVLFYINSFEYNHILFILNWVRNFITSKLLIFVSHLRAILVSLFRNRQIRSEKKMRIKIVLYYCVFFLLSLNYANILNGIQYTIII
jgi:hypothetical protein